MLQQKQRFNAPVPVSGRWDAAVESHQQVLAQCESLGADIDRATTLLRGCLGKILICGNGGSAAHAQHLAAELVVRYRKDREAIPAIALTADSAILTAAGNDLGYVEIFRRQVEALARSQDVLVAISTSGKSPNVYTACHSAGAMGCRVIALTGQHGLYDYIPDVEIRVPSTVTARIQEIHTLIIHTLCEGLEP